MTETLHPGGMIARSAVDGIDPEFVEIAVPDHKGGEVSIQVEKIVLRSIAQNHADATPRSTSELRAEVRRLEHKAARYKEQRRSDAAADALSDAAMLRWVLGEEPE